ncbi:MAG: hypothetical protein B6D47_00110 [Rhodocyclaceae bacterium UTPRO2]|jgi:phage tail tape-measure protein|nr:MAG: hypothetical protein B6D47_00110 [Rhodocyclaceae bacterium UTPRO2]
MADKFDLKAIISAVDKITPTLKGIQRSVRLTGKTIRDIGRNSSQLLASIGLSSAALGGGLAFAVKKVVDVSAEFEKYRTILETIEGSSEKARRSMDWVQDFAVRTPFELAEVTDAFVKLKAYGIDPQAGALTAAGNAAAAMGKSVMQAVEALADAMTGENERLKEFGIKASKQGDQIVYSWTENGKTMVARAKASSKEQIEAVITGIWNRRYGSAMDKLSGTWTGIWSNLMDQVTKFQKMIGDAGIFESLKGEMQGILKLIDQWEADGTLKRVAKEISDGLVTTLKEVVEWVKTVDWRGFLADLRSVVDGVRSFVGWMGGVKNVLIGVGALFLAGPLASIIGIVGALWRFGAGMAILAGGLAPAIAILAGIAGAAYVIYKNFDQLMPYFSSAISSVAALGRAFVGLWNVLAPVVVPVLKLIGRILGGTLIFIIQRVTGELASLIRSLTLGIQLIGKIASFIVPDWVKEAFSGGGVTVNQSASTSTPLVQSGAVAMAAGRQQLTGDMTVRFENAPPGMRVAPGKTNQPGVGFNPDVGYRSFALGAP